MESDSDSENVFRPKKNVDNSQKAASTSVSSTSATSANKCKFCSKFFSRQFNLLRHEKTCKEQKISQSPQVTRKPLYICSKCDVQIADRKNFKRHAKKCVGFKGNKYMECPEPSCSVHFYKRAELIKHLNEEHLQDCAVETLKFESLEKFENFKTEQNVRHFMSCIKHTGTHAGTDVSYLYYVCNFNSQFRTNKCNRPTSIPVCACPARMMVKVLKNGECEVKYIKYHTHELKRENLKYHQYPKEILDKIKTLLDRGVSPRKIRYEVVPEDHEEKHTQKEFLLDLKEIRNIHYRLLRQTHLAEDDAEAVGMLASQFQQEGTLLWYKPQNVEESVFGESVAGLLNPCTIFAFAFQTKNMLKEWITGAERIVCVDGTHNTNRYSFYLLNVIVPDEYGTGYPVAHLISNTLEAEIIKRFFTALKNRHPTININALMTDDDLALWSGFSAVFGCTIIHLLCIWHIHRSWQRQLSAKVKDKDLFTWIYKQLVLMLNEPDQNQFKAMLLSFYEELKKFDLDVPEDDPQRKAKAAFLDYFQTTYGNRCEKWALCYRDFPHAHTDTNMYCEAFHSLFKRRYLGDKVNIRVEDLIKLLLEVSRDKSLDLYKKRTLKINPLEYDNRKLKNDSHKRGMDLPDELVSDNSDKEWIIQSESRENVVHILSLNHPTCPPNDCFIKCVRRECLGLCSHLYSCSCEATSLICKHVHKVHSIQVCKNSQDSENLMDTGDAESDELRLFSSPPTEFPVFHIDTNKKAVERIEKLLDQIRSNIHQEGAQRTTLPHVEGVLKQLVTVTNCANANTVQLPSLPTMNFEPIAPNQKKEKQPVGLFKTVKTAKTKSASKYPSKEEQHTMKRNLLGLDPAVEDIQNFVKSSREELTRNIYKFGENIKISKLKLKSVPLNLPDNEVKRLRLITNNTFVKGWLEDEIIDAYLFIVLKSFTNVLLIECWQAAYLSSSLENVCFNSFDFSDKDFIIIPCNPSSAHWVLLFCCIPLKTIYFLDPANFEEDLSPQAKLYLNFLSHWKSVLEYLFKGDSWKVEILPHYCQKDSVSCGVFICWYAKRLLFNEDITSEFDELVFRQEILNTIEVEGMTDEHYIRPE